MAQKNFWARGLKFGLWVMVDEPTIPVKFQNDAYFTFSDISKCPWQLKKILSSKSEILFVSYYGWVDHPCEISEWSIF